MGLDKRHWLLADFSERITKSKWQEMLLNYEDKITFRGTVVKLQAKDLGYGVVEISKKIED